MVSLEVETQEVTYGLQHPGYGLTWHRSRGVQHWPAPGGDTGVETGQVAHHRDATVPLDEGAANRPAAHREQPVAFTPALGSYLHEGWGERERGEGGGRREGRSR